MYEVLILAAIALFVLSRLYVALGRDDGPPEGRERPGPAQAQGKAQQTVNAPGAESPEPTPIDTQSFTGPAAGVLEEIHRIDPGFTPRGFLRGARSAYEMIVEAFANGDRAKLGPLLDDDVYQAWDAAIARREADGSEPWRLLRLKKAEIDEATLEDVIARVMVRYEAELGDGEKVRTAREIWTFKRDVTSQDPNWLLDDVEIAD